MNAASTSRCPARFVDYTAELLFGIYGLYIYSVIGAAGPYFFLLI
jgi:hypothetical protein